MDKILAKYIYKDYYQLLHDKEVNLALSRKGWVKPAVIPKQRILSENRLIRKHLTQSLNALLEDFEFQRILCQVGYHGPACAESISTTTTTTL